MQTESPTNKSNWPQTAILYLFCRTPLHVGAGASVGAIDLPIIRERHTDFPIIPGSTLKGVFADEWNELKNQSWQRSTEGERLFGKGSDKEAQSGLLQFSEAKLLAFPIRSLKGCFGWISCPLILKRYIRDKEHKDQNLYDGLSNLSLEDNEFLSDQACSLLVDSNSVVLEEYIFNKKASSLNWEELSKLLDFNSIAKELGDNLWEEIPKRLIILSDGMMSFFAKTACEIAQHVKISDETGTAESGALFNQENVPSETLFCSIIRKGCERPNPLSVSSNPPQTNSSSELEPTSSSSHQNNQGQDNLRDPFEILSQKIKEKKYLFQFGADSGTGLGYCSTYLHQQG
ncbi:type III-B CRISPR module RAMP protein Cmr4 [Methylacidiphilum caldifontis]|uniref:Type III-B CRISPR module RAMP protein Cmr4 n=1 Tax=Methylacidiphilum caldifontis TaxID=2795386 RepID=A0A4Y8P6R8_9BACT|nr:type III-B CRISPR module RAMP protein Cmr4 [Methylacidiphilum caldifontis]TFE65872.1 type III-B CRISPR module RAMP protein Cmr4 [Methylacidiphilum caldifontis]